MTALAGVAALATACGGAGSAGRPAVRTPPDLAAFLRSPVASPSSCPPSVSGSTSGLRSPWVGHVDVSVFVSETASPARLHALRAALEAMPRVATVYLETKREAYEEFRRLYTCSAQVAPTQVPASFRLVLRPGTQAQRDDVVRAAAGLTGVDSVSCDPSSPCTAVGRPASPAPTPAGSATTEP